LIAESFAIIVGLIGQYRSEKGGQAQLEYNDFMKWLAKAQHSEMKNILESNSNVATSIKSLLDQDHETFKEKLDKIDAAVTAFASNIEGFGSLARAVNPDAVLSDQSISILEQFEESGATKVLELKMYGGAQYMFIETSGGLEVIDPRFIEDDFHTLLECGLLRHEYNSKGDNLYIFTRAASSLVRDRNS
tara:strand:+ start:688 stop:1257 length:570 start_codon:yes stop_codon:yes gene_type:complete